jgi:hypothetical protein
LVLFARSVISYVKKIQGKNFFKRKLQPFFERAKKTQESAFMTGQKRAKSKTAESLVSLFLSFSMGEKTFRLKYNF